MKHRACAAYRVPENIRRTKFGNFAQQFNYNVRVGMVGMMYLVL